MAKVPVPVSTIMSDPELSISSSPFAPGEMVIKRASFRAGEQPEHLKDDAIPEGQGRGMTGTVILDGKPVPKTAANTAAQEGDRAAQRALDEA